VNQHTNSYFSEVRSDARSASHLDGWLLRSSKGAAYFGVLRSDRVVRLLRDHDFRVGDVWVAGQSNYVLASR
jgi:hypothetical protein